MGWWGNDAPKAPDYTGEINKITENSHLSNQNLAKSYNQKANQFNNTLLGGGNNGGLWNSWNALNRDINSLKLDQIWDNPLTKGYNENRYDRLSGRLKDFENQYGMLDADFEVPDFIKTAQGPTGAITIAGLPGLADPRRDLYEKIGTGIGGARTFLEKLLGERQAEEARFGEARKGFGSTVNQYNTRLGQLGIADLTGMQLLEQDLGRFRDDVRGFSSPIFQQMGGWGDLKLGSSLQALTQGLKGLQNKRTAEEDRIKAFEQGLLGRADELRGRFGQLSLDNEAGLIDYNNAVEGHMRNANRFQSDLGYDFSQELAELMDLDRQGDDMMARRGEELSRVENARKTFSSGIDELMGSLGNANVYDASLFDTYGSSIDRLRADMSGFQSDLNPDFSDLDPRLAEAEELLGGLRTERAAAIDPIYEQIAQAGQGLGDIELWDQEGRTAAADQLAGLQGQLAPYSGGRISDLMGQIGGHQTAIQDQNTAYRNRQGELETEAQALLKELQGGEYRSAEDVTAGQGRVDPLKALIEQFGATQANDELSGLTGLLQGQTNRLEQDAQNVTNRQAQGASLAQRMLNGDPVYDQLRSQSYLGDEELMRLLAMSEEERQRTMASRGTMPSTFAASLGV